MTITFVVGLDIVEDTSCSVDKADEAEKLLIDEVRELGKEALHDWAVGEEEEKVKKLLHDKDGIKQQGKKTPWYTTFGEIAIIERSFLDGCHFLRPFCLSAEVKARGYFLSLQHRITDFWGRCLFFQGFAEKMKEHYGITIPVSSIRKITEAHA